MEITEPLAIPTDLGDYTWRHALVEDAAAIHAMLLAVDAFDGIDSAGSLESTQRELEDTWLGDPRENSLLALTPEGEVAGYGLVFVDQEPLKQRRAFLSLNAHPEHRGQGLRDYLLTWSEARARARLEALDIDLPAVIRIHSEDKLTDRIALLESHAFQSDRSFYRMRRDLRQPLPERPLPAGLSLRGYSPELSRPLMRAFNEAFMDHWNFEPVSAQDWDIWFVGREDFRPNLTYLAMDGDEIAGFSFNGYNPERNRRNGLNEGWIFDLGTRRPWRKRGVASALLVASMRAFLAIGLDHATLGVDTQNSNGALRLYENLGFVPVRRFISFQVTL